jgi:type I restriction enzyme S subunit
MEPSELGDIPTGWRVGKVGDFGKVVTGKTPSTKQVEYWGGSLPFVTPTDFKNYGKFVLSSERKLSSMAISEFKRLIIPENSVVVTCIGSDMGKVARTATSCTTNQQLNSLIFNQINNGVEYAYQFLISQYKMLRLMALGGSTMPIINKKDFSDIEILIPEASTLDQFNQVVETTNLKIINNEQQIQTLTKARDMLLPKLMSGKLRITP